jgi:hypothetical protein
VIPSLSSVDLASVATHGGWLPVIEAFVPRVERRGVEIKFFLDSEDRRFLAQVSELNMAVPNTMSQTT